MKKLILPSFVVAIAFFAVNTKVFAQKKEKDKVLANKIYTIELTETGGKKHAKPESDEISFKGEKLNSKFMTSEYKIPAAPYTVSVDSSATPKTITFQSESKGQDGEELKWDGTITDEAIEGTAVISKKGKTKKDYSFTGSLKGKPSKKK
jgi:archaellum component FlaF (FlaF/FlaG flagellin family)